MPVLEPDGSIREWVGSHTEISEHDGDGRRTGILMLGVEPTGGTPQGAPGRET